MEPTSPSPEATAQRFVEAINRHDVEALAALMSAGHRFIDSLGTTIKGRDKMRLGWAGYGLAGHRAGNIFEGWTLGFGKSLEHTGCNSGAHRR